MDLYDDFGISSFSGLYNLPSDLFLSPFVREDSRKRRQFFIFSCDSIFKLSKRGQKLRENTHTTPSLSLPESLKLV